MAWHFGKFLCIQASVRRIIQFDPVQISNRSRFQQLRQSFNYVVLLNQCFHDLSAQKLASTNCSLTTTTTSGITPSYGQALPLAEELHQEQRLRSGVEPPFRGVQEQRPDLK